MAGRSAPTRVATILLLDIVGSTGIASEIGDARWRAALNRFRRIVRHDLRAHDGHEEDTAGDGFFATFHKPVAALRCAATIASDVQQLGLDVRCGLHVGEVGIVEDGRPGGLAVHVAARVMALAGPGEVLCTTTLRDLVLGSEIRFADRGSVILRDVPGEWHLVTVVATPEPLPAALDTEEAQARRASIEPEGPKATRFVLVGVIATAAALGGVLWALQADPPAKVAPHEPPALIRIDPETNAIVQSVGVMPADSQNTVLGADEGVLWQVTSDALIARRIADGAEPLRIDVGPDAVWYAPTFAFGAGWTLEERYASGLSTKLIVTRWDDRTGAATSFHVKGAAMVLQTSNAFLSFVAGPDAIWFLMNEDTRVHRLDPTSGEVESWSTGRWDGPFGPTQVYPTDSDVWLCAPFDGLLLRFDIAAERIAGRMSIPEDTCPVAVESDGPRTSVWLLDRVSETITQVDPAAEVTLGSWAVGPSHGEVNSIGASGYGFGSLWFPAGDYVYRFDLESHESTPIAMPEGISASTVVADEASGTVWASNCDPSWCDWIPA